MSAAVRPRLDVVPVRSPRASVVVPSYRSAGTISACLGSLLAQEPRFSFEVIVVDSAPDDAAAEIVRRSFPSVRLIPLERRTEAPLARNRGAGAARGDLLAFLDADCVAPPGWLERLAGALDAGYDGVGGAIANGNGHSLVSWAGYVCEFREFLPGGTPRPAAYMTPGNVAYRRSAFLDAGGFPAGCFPLEDQVLGRRLRERGARLLFDPGVVVYHHHRTRRDDFFEHQRLFGRVNAKVVRELKLPGASLARSRGLAWAALPGLVALKFLRTLYACRGVERGLLWRRPRLAWLTWRGLCAWGRGFVEGSGGAPPAAWPALAASVGSDDASDAPAAGASALSTEAPVSVVVATLDRPESLRQVLRGLRAQLGSRPVEIVVADNNPASGLTPPVVREAAGVRLVPEPRGGLSFARNAGIRASSGEIVVTVDDDVVLPEGWLEQLLAPFADPGVGIVTGRIVPEALDTNAARAFETRGSLASGPDPLEADRAFFDSFRLRAVPTWSLGSGANVALRRSVLSAVGLFDEALGAGTPAGAGEESDLFYRALRGGIRLRYEPRAVLRHRHHRTMAALRRRVYGYSKGHVAYHLNTLLRHGDARALAQVLVAQPVDIARRLLRHSLIEGRYPASLIAWELLGYLAGPIAFARSRLRARRLGAGHPGSHALPAAGVRRPAEAADVATPAAHGQPG